MFVFSDRFRLDIQPKIVHWDCPWDIEEDSKLLKGVYEYGMGSWEAMKMDPHLQLDDKVKLLVFNKINFVT